MFFLSEFAQYMYTTNAPNLVRFIINFVFSAAISLKSVYCNKFVLDMNIYILQYFYTEQSNCSPPCMLSWTFDHSEDVCGGVPV